ncbi:MAG: PEGA domain-containing protein [Balneolaceae bacterium]|nr:PEGA domain-containing protein [Balneolaceae bacterium]
MKSHLFAVIILAFLIQGCGSIMHGSTQEVSVSSSPSNATVSVNGNTMGETPILLDLGRKNTHLIEVSMDGYETYEQYLTRSTSGWVWGNIVFGGIIGLVVDASSGGMYKLTPDQIRAEMQSQKSEAKISGDGLYLAIVLEPNEDWERIGTIDLQEKTEE